MRKTFKHIFVALAVTAMLAGCAKEITPPNFENDKVNPAAEGSRVIAVAFAPQTKTELDGFQPKFVDNDSILISNGVAIDTCEVNVESNPATISTDLDGPLTAVYPYKAAKMDENNVSQIDTVLVSTVQSGAFADANICMAKMENENDGSLSFVNKTAVFCIKPPTGNPGYVEISAEGFDIANNVPTGAAKTDSSTIRVAPVTADSVYVSILVPSGLKIGDLKFSDGTNEKTITETAKASAAVAAGTLYTVTDKNWGWPSLGIGEFYDCLVLSGEDDYGIAQCTVLQSPDGAKRYRIMNPYDKARRAASWDEDSAQATPSDYIEFWVTDETTMRVTWDSFWLTGLWYSGNPGDDIKAYLPSMVVGQSDENCRFVEEKVVRFTPYYYIDGIGGFGCYDCYLSMPGGPDLEEWLNQN